MRHQTASMRAAVTAVVLSTLVFVQAPRTPDDAPPVFERSQDPPRSKSDAYRYVGKVLAIEKDKGMVKLSTEDGERTLKAPAPLLGAIRVGDTISVPRPDDEPVSASPRKK
jgi:hypothetical protein